MSRSKLDTIAEILKMASLGHPFADDPRLRRRLQAERDMASACQSISDLLAEIL